jgi:hypothetical protein
MAYVTQCDRCGVVGPTPCSFNIGALQVDLCSDCGDALHKFLDNEPIAEAELEEVELRCPHYVPCAYPCQGTVFRRKR